LAAHVALKQLKPRAKPARYLEWHIDAVAAPRAVPCVLQGTRPREVVAVAVERHLRLWLCVQDGGTSAGWWVSGSGLAGPALARCQGVSHSLTVMTLSVR
jgi:hypothetical protein